jgi:hypothetical protein
MISGAWGDLLKESQLNYPKRGCRFAKRNMPTVCDEHVTKLEQFCKIFSPGAFSAGPTGLATRKRPFQSDRFFRPLSFESPASIPKRAMPPRPDSAFARACRPRGAFARLLMTRGLSRAGASPGAAAGFATAGCGADRVRQGP